MGGTSTDVALVDGEVVLTSEGRLGPYPWRSRWWTSTASAGGGSIAYADAGGLLRVGPASAGADPGPACYGRGGGEPTVTDANLVLGRLPADSKLAGSVTLDVAAAHAAVGRLAARLGMPVIEDVALGIVAIANEHMAHALRVISLYRGLDPRRFPLFCFGGAGGLHVCDLAKRWGSERPWCRATPGSSRRSGCSPHPAGGSYRERSRCPHPRPAPGDRGCPAYFGQEGLAAMAGEGMGAPASARIPVSISATGVRPIP